jgi:hypothetical protein
MVVVLQPFHVRTLVERKACILARYCAVCLAVGDLNTCSTSPAPTKIYRTLRAVIRLDRPGQRTPRTFWYVPTSASLGPLLLAWGVL